MPIKKQGKRSTKKHLSKEAFINIRYKHDMWRVYKHTGKEKDYEVYKKKLNEATNESRKRKRNFEHKLAQHIKTDSKSLYAYGRSKQSVRDKVGPLEDNAVNIITPGLLMAEELNMQEGFVPLEWKETNIIPLFKKNLRNKSVSLTSVICKLLETITRNHTIDFLIKHKLLKPSQQGILKARSCVTNFGFSIEEITKLVDEGSLIDVLYLDFQKAFDNVPHQRLILKLKSHGYVWLCNVKQSRQCHYHSVQHNLDWLPNESHFGTTVINCLLLTHCSYY